MKLVDILARDLKVWPEHCKAIEQDRKGYCIYHAGGGPLDERVDGLADDAETAVVTRAQWRAAVDALKAENCDHLWIGWSDTEACELCNKTRKIVVEWNDEGLPPVGADVEVRFACEENNSEWLWHRGTVIAVGSQPEGGEIVVVNAGGVLACYRGGRSHIRPIRTPEQIAAEGRKIAIQKMMVDASNFGRGVLSFASAESLYDAGYRKFEIVEG